MKRLLIIIFCFSTLVCKSQIDGYKKLKIGGNLFDKNISENFILQNQGNNLFLLKSKTPQYICEERIGAFSVKLNSDSTIKTIEVYTLTKKYNNRSEFLEKFKKISQLLVDAFGKADDYDAGDTRNDGRMRIVWLFPDLKTMFLVYVTDPPTSSKNVEISYRMVWSYYKPIEETEKKPKISPKFSSGTGVLVKNDLIITCYHVVKDGKQILIRGVNGRFDSTYLAEISFFDEELDIAFLKISNSLINKKINLPYSLKEKETDVGESIFVLGYPLQNTMGQEIKLTTGVISSNSGFLGDTNLFQISAPIQPGNSGGPLFDNNGNLIGIVSAKHNKADNVGYAVKLSLFRDFLRRNGIIHSTNKYMPAELSKKVKLFKDYIYSIEVALE